MIPFKGPFRDVAVSFQGAWLSANKSMNSSNSNYITNCDKTAAQRVLLIGFSVLSKLVIPFTPPGDPQKIPKKKQQNMANVRPSHLSIMLSALAVVARTKRRIQKTCDKKHNKKIGETTTTLT